MSATGHAIGAVAVPIAISSASLLAQAIPEVGNWAQWIANTGGFGVLAWYLWYDTSIARPKMVQQFRDELEASRKTDDVRHNQLVKDFRDELNAYRLHVSEQLEAQRVSKHALADAVHALAARFDAAFHHLNLTNTNRQNEQRGIQP